QVRTAGPGFPQARKAILGYGYVVALDLQIVAEAERKVRVVFNDEYAAHYVPGTSELRCGCEIARLVAANVCIRELHHNARAPAGCGLRPRIAAVQPRELAHDRQSDATARDTRLDVARQTVERLEHPRPLLCRDPRPLVV